METLGTFKNIELDGDTYKITTDEVEINITPLRGTKVKFPLSLKDFTKKFRGTLLGFINTEGMKTDFFTLNVNTFRNTFNKPSVSCNTMWFEFYRKNEEENFLDMDQEAVSFYLEDGKTNDGFFSISANRFVPLDKRPRGSKKL